MPKLHISRDETGYWQLSLEADDGGLTLLSHHFPTPDHLIQDARELVEDGKVPDGVILIAPETVPTPTHLGTAAPLAGTPHTAAYQKPAPRKVVQ